MVPIPLPTIRQTRRITLPVLKTLLQVTLIAFSHRRQWSFFGGKARLFLLLLVSTITPAHAAEIEGVLDWAGRVELSTTVPGIIVTIPVKPGTVVEKDTILLSVKGGVFQAIVDSAKAAVQMHSRLQAEATRELERTQELYDNTLISEHALEVAHISHEKAVAAHAKALANLAQAESNFYHSSIHAPFKGLILNQLVGLGQVVSPIQKPSPMLIFAKANAMVAKARINYPQGSGLKVGQKIAVEVKGKKVKGSLLAIGPDITADPKEQDTLIIEVELPLNSKQYSPGTKVKLVLP